MCVCVFVQLCAWHNEEKKENPTHTLKVYAHFECLVGRDYRFSYFQIIK